MIDPQFYPHISVLIPVHNEEKVIYSKLENLFNIIYPPEKIEVIVIDYVLELEDGDTDLFYLKSIKINLNLHKEIIPYYNINVKKSF